eukprot:1316621-Amorphochlora_amoeboformis.AAC.2
MIRVGSGTTTSSSSAHTPDCPIAREIHYLFGFFAHVGSERRDFGRKACDRGTYGYYFDCFALSYGNKAQNLRISPGFTLIFCFALCVMLWGYAGWAVVTPRTPYASPRSPTRTFQTVRNGPSKRLCVGCRELKSDVQEDINALKAQIEKQAEEDSTVQIRGSHPLIPD